MTYEYNRHERFEEALAVYARQALKGQTPATLLTLSIGVDREEKWLRIRGHFESPPSEDDIEDIRSVGTEIISQWVPDGWLIDEDWEASPPGQQPDLLPGGIAWRRGDPEPPIMRPQA